MIPLTLSQFRSDFPEFSDSAAYSDALLTTWTTLAPGFVDEARWNEFSTYGAELVAAHFIVLAKRRQAAALAGAIPGEPKGLQTGKSVGDVSASYDLSPVLAADAGMWNQTTYGLEYQRLLRMFGAGGLQL